MTNLWTLSPDEWNQIIAIWKEIQETEFPNIKLCDRDLLQMTLRPEYFIQFVETRQELRDRLETIIDSL